MELGIGAARGLPYKDSPQLFLSSGAKASMKPLCFMDTFRWATYSASSSAGGKALSPGNGAKVSIPKARELWAKARGSPEPPCAQFLLRFIDEECQGPRKDDDSLPPFHS